MVANFLPLPLLFVARINVFMTIQTSLNKQYKNVSDTLISNRMHLLGHDIFMFIAALQYTVYRLGHVVIKGGDHNLVRWQTLTEL